jgi:catechol 2,3-dioxygenase-like lactoylglutathione lyase family enzyme
MTRMLVREPSHWWGTNLDAPDPVELARFYHRLLGWPIVHEKPDYAIVSPPDSNTYLAFQKGAGYERPTWPNAAGRQQMMMHLDLEVGDLEESVARAVAEGATVAEFQPQQTVRVLLDPAGHPFCLYVDAPVVDPPAVDASDVDEG